MPKERLGYLPGRTRQLGEGSGHGVDVLHRRQGNGNAGEAAQPGRPDAGGGYHKVRFYITSGGANRGNVPVYDPEAGDLDVAVEPRSASLGAARHRLGRPHCLRVDIRRDVEGAQYALGEHGEQITGLGGIEDTGLNAPAEAEPGLPLQIGEPLGRPCHLHAAYGFGTWSTVKLQPRKQIDGVTCKPRHGPGRVDLKDETWCVRR